MLRTLEFKTRHSPTRLARAVTSLSVVLCCSLATEAKARDGQILDVEHQSFARSRCIIAETTAVARSSTTTLHGRPPVPSAVALSNVFEGEPVVSDWVPRIFALHGDRSEVAPQPRELDSLRGERGVNRYPHCGAITDPRLEARIAAGKVIAERWLGNERCQVLVRRLTKSWRSTPAEVGAAAISRLRQLRFRNGDDCRIARGRLVCEGLRHNSSPGMWTFPGQITIGVCEREFLQGPRSLDAVLVLHELLHSLGVGERRGVAETHLPTHRELNRLICGSCGPGC